MDGSRRRLRAARTKRGTGHEHGELVRARLAAIVECSDDAIFSKSLEGVITSWNAAAERMFGWPAADAVGRPITLIIPPDRRAEEVQVLARLRLGEALDHFETVRVTRDGRLLDISLSVSPVKDAAGRIVGISGIARDVTTQKHLQAELSRRVEELAAADQRKDEFLAMLGHELRNPLSAVRNAVVVARLDPSRREQALDIAQRQADHLARLVDDLLDVARITQGRLPLRMEPVDLAGIAARAVETVRGYAESRAHEIALILPDEPTKVHADPARLEQVAANLLGNAIKYTEPGGRIEVAVRREGAAVVLSVRDTGIGIAPDMLSRVFDLFAQAHRSLDRCDGGLGVGLTVVRRLVELHGGRVEARSEGLGKGAEFRVSLPGVRAADSASVHSRSSVPLASRPAEVLVVEDNSDAALGLKLLLELQGHRVRLAQDGPSALEAAHAKTPDIMLVDIGLPGMDGYEVARSARREPGLEGVVLIALTGYGRDDDRRRAFEAGFDDHLVKPMTVEAFERMLGRLAS